MIRKTKLHGTTEKDYLYEATVIDPKIKNLKNQIKLLKYRLTGEKQKKERFMEKPKSVCFGGRKNLKHDMDTYRYNRRKRMLICGRRQGKYGNNLFKYHIDEGILVYRGIRQEIRMPVVFHQHRDHIALAETDRKGNLVKAWRIPLKERGTRNQREYERYVLALRQVGMQIGSRLFAYDFGYKIIFLLVYVENLQMFFKYDKIFI
ncbi:hypothetical protein [Traorella massiliensis]|uniref:hypothetical protein n=1 Tax=Traorella massiliensis TaxID=1903263 RepID=UPI0008F8E525|nr:hypothetical protein [Traorella massiliensis]